MAAPEVLPADSRRSAASVVPPFSRYGRVFILSRTRPYLCGSVSSIDDVPGENS
jgi:hypothetical protein